MKNKNQTKENWEKEFEKEFDMYNPIHDDGTKIPVWSGSDFENIKSFIRQLLIQEKEKWLNLILERIKLKEKKVHYISAFLEMSHEKIRQEANEMGYNQAIADLEKLKEALKKELKVGGNK